eukprot:TRINITY_DN27478_c0_g1_i1.p1 TRINITY_DN27478_c0_g1~~TRINITY_DN27478_c0_g1_i1.p1  ORF type:complete len:453 (+),score=89.23 TRINITY_DN27478_c0_g1_i1:98-1456(+)
MSLPVGASKAMAKKRKLTVIDDTEEVEDEPRRSWRSGEYSDWKLTLGDKEYAIHKIIVSTGNRCSLFLRACFRKHCDDKDITDLSELLPKVCWEHFDSLLDFIYDVDIAITPNAWGALLKMSDVLQVRLLRRSCCEAASDLISSPIHSPRIVSDAVKLKVGAEVEQQAIQIAVDVMVPNFSMYESKDLAMLPDEVFQQILRRDDLEMADEDALFDLLLGLSSLSASGGSEACPANVAELWKCCRFHNLSPDRTVRILTIPEIPKEAVVWALTQKAASALFRSPSTPPTGCGWCPEGAHKERGRELTFFVPNPLSYAIKKSVRSVPRQLTQFFKWRLLVFPQGTEQTGNPKQPAAFLELVPEQAVRAGWTFRNVKYSITLVNWLDERKNVTKEHSTQFTYTELDNGWHRGFLPNLENVSAGTSQGWLGEQNSALCFKAKICIRESMCELVDEP